MNYQQECENFANHSSQFQEHNEDNGAEDYYHEVYAGDADQFAWCEDFTEEDHAWCEAHGVTDEASYNQARKTLDGS